MKYLGMEFKNYEELNNWNRARHISEYKKLAQIFSKNQQWNLAA